MFTNPAVLKSKSTFELLRMFAVFRIAGSSLVVSNSRRIIDASYSILGTRATNAALKATFFGHFCGGETLADVKAAVETLERLVGSLNLKYSTLAETEPEVDEEEDYELKPVTRVRSARVFRYVDESAQDANCDLFCECIENVAKASPEAFAAIKITALGRPRMLLKLSEVLVKNREAFRNALAGKEVPTELQGTRGKFMSQTLNKDQLRYWLDQLGIPMSNEALENLWEQLDVEQDGTVDYVEWMTFLDPSNKEHRKFFIASLADEEQQELDNMIKRIERITQLAAKKKVRLMIDAEHTFYQSAIDHLTVAMQRKWNGDFPLIYGTYQAYLRDSFSRYQVDMLRAKREGWIFAAKIVRGAYLNFESDRAAKLGVPSPIWENIEATHKNYDAMISHTLSDLSRRAMMIATHNQASVEKAVSLLDGKTDEEQDRVAFGQLLGMCDFLTFPLGEAGYHAFKYVPYGPVREVVPYLIRRAEENSSMFGSPSVTTEKQLVNKELLRRLWPFSRKD